jgi:peptide/nickel transport system permease protein
MLALVVRRLASLIPTLLVVSIAVFALSLGIGTEQAAATRAGDTPNAQAIARAKAELHLNDPIATQYVDWLDRTVHLDFGRSFIQLETVNGTSGTEVQGQLVRSVIGHVFPRTLSLVLISLVFATVLGSLAGVIAGIRPGTVTDRVVMTVSTLGLAIPAFWVGMLLVAWLAVDTHLLPAVGYQSISQGGLLGWLGYLLIPGLALALTPAAVIARLLRGAMAEVMSSAYIRTAWAKGATLYRVAFRHALRNAASVPLTVFATLLIQLLGGTVVIESLFGIDGMGELTLTSVRGDDIPMLQGIVMVCVVMAVVINLLVDLALGLLNPKVRVT